MFACDARFWRLFRPRSDSKSTLIGSMSSQQNDPSLKLPPELVEKIVEPLSDDKTALPSLSLVFKAWRPLVHGHLFHRIRIQPPHNERCDGILECSALSCYIRHAALVVFGDSSNEEVEVEHLLGSITRVKQTNPILKA
ncbi:hypothetical protein L218DRAFT_1006929 [Marasmius fiardii PR-910]|nr:hypothetical protein L218DRAFT_1006929 [Marasmius fiardii PR-910]